MDINKKENENTNKLAKAYKLIIVALVLIILAFILGIVVLKLFGDEEGQGNSIINTPDISATSKPIPNVTDIVKLSEELLQLDTTEVEWNKKAEDSNSKGLYCISDTNEKYLVYNIDSNNISNEGYTLADFDHIWINSEDNNFYAVINLSGEVVDLSGYYILVRDETRTYAARAIINCYEAKEVILKGTAVTGTIIAPYANIVYEDTYVYGQVHGKSYEGTQKFYKEVLFTGYSSLMSDLRYADIKVDAIRIAAIEFLVENDDLGTYSDYTTGSKLRLKDTHAITSLILDGKKLKVGEELTDEIGSDLSFFENLTYLSCDDTELAKIDLSHVPNLTKLSINNTKISEIDLSHTPLLTELSANNTLLENIDLSMVPKLYKLSLNNTKLAELDLSSQKDLLDLSIAKLPLKELDLSNNTKLVNYNYSDTKLPLPDFNVLTKLEYVNCSNSGLEEFTVGSASLKTLDASNNKGLRNIDFEMFPNLVSLDISKCSFSNINLSIASTLQTLIASFNNFKTVDVGSAPSLYRVELYGDSIKTIDVKGKSNIRVLCSDKVEIIGKEEPTSETSE